MLLLIFSMLSKEEQPTCNVSLSWEHGDFYIHVWPRLISENYVGILVIYYPLIYYGIFDGSRLHLMLVFSIKK